MAEHLGRWNLEGYKRVVGFTFEEVDPELLKILIGCDVEEVIPLSDAPLYEIEQDEKTGMYDIIYDEGWRIRTVCTSMHKSVADWLLTMIQDRPMPNPE